MRNSPLSNTLLGCALEAGMEALRPLLLAIVAFGVGVAILASMEAQEQARHWSQSSAWRRKREEQERGARERRKYGDG